MFTRRSFVALGAMAGLSACATTPPPIPAVPSAPVIPTLPDFYGAITTEPYPIPAIPEGKLPQRYWRQEVANPWPNYSAGTIVVDPDAAMLHFVEDEDRATRYGVSVGAAGFAWQGTARLQFCRKWPRWKVPQTMIARKPELEPYSVANGGMDPGSIRFTGFTAMRLILSWAKQSHQAAFGC